MRKHRNQVRAGLTAAVIAAALAGVVGIAHADDTAPVREDVHAFHPAGEALFELKAISGTDRGTQPRTLAGSLSGAMPFAHDEDMGRKTSTNRVQGSGSYVEG